MDPHRLNREFDPHVRATQRQISGKEHGLSGSSGWTALWWIVAAVLLALVAGATVVAFVVLRG